MERFTSVKIYLFFFLFLCFFGFFLVFLFLSFCSLLLFCFVFFFVFAHATLQRQNAAVRQRCGSGAAAQLFNLCMSKRKEIKSLFVAIGFPFYTRTEVLTILRVNKFVNGQQSLSSVETAVTIIVFKRYTRNVDKSLVIDDTRRKTFFSKGENQQQINSTNACMASSLPRYQPGPHFLCQPLFLFPLKPTYTPKKTHFNITQVSQYFILYAFKLSI